MTTSSLTHTATLRLSALLIGLVTVAAAMLPLWQAAAHVIV